MGVTWPTTLDAFYLERPAIVHFSGGRTSGALVHQVLQAFGGKLPEDVHVVFADTGRELPETLAFVDELARRWGVTIHRVERPGRFARMLYDEQRAAAVRRRRARLPSVRTRWCTIRLKRSPAERHALQHFGDRESAHGAYGRVEGLSWVLGIRADEPQRAARLRQRGGEKRPVYWPLWEPHTMAKGSKPPRMGYVDYDYEMPLVAAGWTEADVRDFWDAQPFDLGIPSSLGNCDGCFMKAGDKRLAAAIAAPDRVQVWADDEARFGDRYRPDGAPPAELLKEAARLKVAAPTWVSGLAERLDDQGRHRAGLQLSMVLEEPALGACTLCDATAESERDVAQMVAAGAMLAAARGDIDVPISDLLDAHVVAKPDGCFDVLLPPLTTMTTAEGGDGRGT